MIIRKKTLALSLFALGFITPVLAKPQENNAQLIDTLTQRTQTLEAEVHELQTEIQMLKHASPQVLKQAAAPSRSANDSSASNGTSSAPSSSNGVCDTKQPKYIIVYHRHEPSSGVGVVPAGSLPISPTAITTAHPATQIPVIPAPNGQAPVQNNGQVMMQRPVAGSPSEPVPLSLLVNAPLTLGGMPVVTSPYLGIRSAFDASDLVSNFPNVNLPFRLLQQRQKIENVFKENHQPYPDNPFVDLSGTVQPIMFFNKPYQGSWQNGIDLPTASLDAMGNINRWVMSFIRFSFDNNPPGNFTPPIIGPVIANSRVFLDQGFVSIGNLNCSPIYFTMGQIFVPFGKYSSNMISSTLPQLLGRTKARAVTLGLYKEWKNSSLNLQGFVFRGDARLTHTSSKMNQGGANIDYALNFSKWNTLVGASYIANIADSLNMQQNGAAIGFAGFAGPFPTIESEVLAHRVPGVDVHGSLGIGKFGFLAEYVTATTDFAFDDLTFNGHGARPSAASFEAVYNFNICNMPASIAAGYQQTRQALAVLLPRERYLGAFNISIWKDTIESIEVRHDVNYDSDDFATGRGVAVDTTGLGNSSNAITLQIAVYF